MKKVIALFAVLLTICPFTSFAGNRHDMAGIQFKVSNGWPPSVNRYTITIPRSDGSELLMVTHMPSQRNSPSLPEIMAPAGTNGKKIPEKLDRERFGTSRIQPRLGKGILFHVNGQVAQTQTR